MRCFLCFFQLRFTPCKTEQLLKGMQLQEKEEQKAEMHLEKLFKENPNKKGVYQLQT